MKHSEQLRQWLKDQKRYRDLSDRHAALSGWFLTHCASTAPTE